MRRFLLALLLLVCFAVPVSTHASGWHTYTNRSLGFGLRYPSGWQVMVSTQLGERLVSLTSQQRYSVQISVLRVMPGKNARQLAARVLRYQTRRGVTTFSRLRWKATTLGGRFADVAIIGASTEAGVALSQAFYLAPGRGMTYQIMIPVNSRTPLHSVSRFPPVYRQILSTWRYF